MTLYICVFLHLFIHIHMSVRVLNHVIIMFIHMFINVCDFQDCRKQCQFDYECRSVEFRAPNSCRFFRSDVGTQRQGAMLSRKYCPQQGQGYCVVNDKLINYCKIRVIRRNIFFFQIL